MQGKIASIVENHLSKIISELGYELYEVEYLKKQNGMNLTLFITSNDHTINIKDCESVHRTVDPILDELDPTNGESYYLNVSSVGLDKPLKNDKDFKRCLGKEVIVKQFVQTDGKKEFIGIISSFDDNNLYLDVEGGTSITISRQNIALCKQNIKF